jgi:hypothetical protein
MAAGVDIPTLCFNEELSPAGACRLCVVEVGEGDNCALVTACDNPVCEGMVVNTKSPRAVASRKMAAELLLAQTPTSEKLQKIAHDMGVDGSRFGLPLKECICAGCACAPVGGGGRRGYQLCVSRPRRDVEPHVVFDRSAVLPAVRAPISAHRGC